MERPDSSTLGAPRELTWRQHLAARHRSKKSLWPGRAVDSYQFERFPPGIDRSVKDVGRNMNQVTRGNRLPGLTLDIDHLLPLTRHPIEDLFRAGMYVPDVTVAGIQDDDPRSEPFRVRDPRFAQPLNGAPVEHLRFHIAGSDEPLAWQLCHKSPSFSGQSARYLSRIALKRLTCSVIACSVGRRSTLDAPKKPAMPRVRLNT